MAEAKPRFITFGISHFCEKARWALDWHGIAYDETGWPPGLHHILAKRCGAKSSVLPLLLDGERVVQGSGPIIDWADSRSRNGRRSLTPATCHREAKEIERRADATIGVHARRLAFAEMLPEHPHLLKPALFLRTSSLHRLIGDLMWPLTRRRMLVGMDLRPGAAAESRTVLEAELDWLDATLADGRAYLAGDSFTRADLTVASLLATFARPAEMPVYHNLQTPESLDRIARAWSERPTMRFVREQYRKHRGESGAASG